MLHRAHPDMLANILIRRLRLNILLIKSHISMRIRHPVLDCRRLIGIESLDLAVCSDIILQQIQCIPITQNRRPMMMLLLKIGMMF